MFHSNLPAAINDNILSVQTISRKQVRKQIKQQKKREEEKEKEKEKEIRGCHTHLSPNSMSSREVNPKKKRAKEKRN